MNTPEPCSRCGFLYSDCMQRDNSTYTAECIKELRMGDLNCPSFKDWRLVTMGEKWNLQK